MAMTVQVITAVAQILHVTFAHVELHPVANVLSFDRHVRVIIREVKTARGFIGYL